MNEIQLRSLLEKAYKAGWDASGEGWNAEYPGNAHERPGWEVERNEAIEKIIEDML